MGRRLNPKTVHDGSAKSVIVWGQLVEKTKIPVKPFIYFHLLSVLLYDLLNT